MFLPMIRLQSILGLLATSVAFAADPLRIATFRVDVTPPLGSPLCCSAGVKPAAKIVDPLSARGIILLGPPKPIVLAAVDWEGIANEGWDEWRRAIATLRARRGPCQRPYSAPA